MYVVASCFKICENRYKALELKKVPYGNYHTSRKHASQLLINYEFMITTINIHACLTHRNMPPVIKQLLIMITVILYLKETCLPVVFFKRV